MKQKQYEKKSPETKPKLTEKPLLKPLLML